MSAIEELARFIAQATEEFRKGEEVTTKTSGSLTVTEVYAMPHEDEARTPRVDLHFIQVRFTEGAADEKQFIDLLKQSLAEPGSYHTFTVHEFLGGPSYITTGGWLGSQDLALRLYALLEHYELAKVITPAVMHIEGPKADEMAGMGFVMFAPSQKLSDALKENA